MSMLTSVIKQAAKEHGLMEHKGRTIPKEVKSLADRIRKEQPGKDDEYAYRTAWDIFRSYTPEGKSYPRKSEDSGLKREGGGTGPIQKKAGLSFSHKVDPGTMEGLRSAISHLGKEFRESPMTHKLDSASLKNLEDLVTRAKKIDAKNLIVPSIVVGTGLALGQGIGSYLAGHNKSESLQKTGGSYTGFWQGFVKRAEDVSKEDLLYTLKKHEERETPDQEARESEREERVERDLGIEQ